MNKSEIKTRIAPSVFAADFSDIAAALAKMESANVDLIHYDVMDNHFVPNISFGAKFISDVCARTSIPGDVHLMTDLEGRFDGWGPLEVYLGLPVENITIHLEATQNYLLPLLEKIRKSGKKAGVSLKPSTPVESLIPYLDSLDLILMMSVEPGFSGQKFMPDVIERIIELKKHIGKRAIDIQVDGGVGRSNYETLINAGATNLVMGSAFFADDDPIDLVDRLHNLKE